MKNIIRNFIYLPVMILFVACSSNDDNPGPGNSTEVSNALKSGTWKITYFWDTDKDETGNFTGYNFTFGENGSLAATNGVNTYNGSWNTVTDDSHVKLNINFNAPEEFVDISEDWHVIEQSSTKIKLEDVSGGNGGTDYLHFEKN